MSALILISVQVATLIAPSSVVATAQEVEIALLNIRKALPKTTFVNAWPAALPGFIAVQLSDGSVAYTDKTGRYLILGLIIDSHKGEILDKQLDGKP